MGCGGGLHAQHSSCLVALAASLAGARPRGVSANLGTMAVVHMKVRALTQLRAGDTPLTSSASRTQALSGRARAWRARDARSQFTFLGPARRPCGPAGGKGSGSKGRRQVLHEMGGQTAVRHSQGGRLGRHASHHRMTRHGWYGVVIGLGTATAIRQKPWPGARAALSKAAQPLLSAHIQRRTDARWGHAGACFGGWPISVGLSSPPTRSECRRAPVGAGGRPIAGGPVG